MVVRRSLCHHGQSYQTNDTLTLSTAVGKSIRLATLVLEIAMHFCTYPRSVYVRPYVRFRFGRLENVCEHCRSLPGQLTLFN